jgi:uncharacterized protein (DUF4415 family)
LDEAFSKNAQIAQKRPRRNISMQLRLDPETRGFFRSAGRGRLTRMANILKAYVEAQAGFKPRLGAAGSIALPTA